MLIIHKVFLEMPLNVHLSLEMPLNVHLSLEIAIIRDVWPIDLQGNYLLHNDDQMKIYAIKADSLI